MQEAKGHGGLLPAHNESLAVQITVHMIEQCGACGFALQVKVAERGEHQHLAGFLFSPLRIEPTISHPS